MVVMIMERVTPSARGELTRWLLEVKSGVFIGYVNARVRDRLWEKCTAKNPVGGIFQAWSTNNEQKFDMRMVGETSRIIIEEEGIRLIKISGESEKFLKRNFRRNPDGKDSD